MLTSLKFSTVWRTTLCFCIATCLLSCSTTSSRLYTSETSGKIGGRIVNELGTPVEGAQIIFLQSHDSPFKNSRNVVETDAEGRWQDVAPQRNPLDLFIIVQHADYAPTIAKSSPSLHAELTDRTATFIIRKGFEISGIITNTAGKPISGAMLRVYLSMPETRYQGYWPIIGRSGLDGTFNLIVPEEVNYNTFIFAKGYHEQFLEVPFAVKASPLTFTLTPYEQLRGRIMDESAHPIENAEIELHPSDEELWNSLELSAGPDGWCAQTVGGESWVRKSDSDGIFAWNELEKTRYDLTVKCEGFRDVALNLPTSKDIQTITLKRLPTE